MSFGPTTIVLDNATILNACHLLSAEAPLTAVGIRDLAALVDAIMLGDKIVTLAGHSYETAIHGRTTNAWNLTSSANVVRTLTSFELLSHHTIGASWHNDQLEGREAFDAYTALLDLDAVRTAVRDLDVASWTTLVFGEGMQAWDSNPIYAAPPPGAQGSMISLRDRLTDPASLFVSQTLFYCWFAYEQDLPLLVSHLRRPIATAAHEALRDTSRSVMRVALDKVAEAQRQRLDDLALDFNTIAPQSFCLPACLSYVLEQSEGPGDILRVAIDARADSRFVNFRAWISELDDALRRGDLRAYRRIARQAGSRSSQHGTVGEVLVGAVLEPRALLKEQASIGVDAILRALRSRVTLISDMRTGKIGSSVGLRSLEHVLGQELSRTELAKFARD
jgi:hypothetical protein